MFKALFALPDAASTTPSKNCGSRIGATSTRRLVIKSSLHYSPISRVYSWSTTTSMELGSIKSLARGFYPLMSRRMGPSSMR